jgi:hypothetical protein
MTGTIGKCEGACAFERTAPISNHTATAEAITRTRFILL